MNAGYRDRRDGGRALGESLAEFIEVADTILVALPSGGVPVAHEVARQLRLPLKLLFVRRVRLPNSELSVGSVGLGGIRVLSDDTLALLKASPLVVDAAVEREARALAHDEARCSAPSRPMTSSIAR